MFTALGVNEVNLPMLLLGVPIKLITISPQLHGHPTSSGGASSRLVLYVLWEEICNLNLRILQTTFFSSHVGKTPLGDMLVVCVVSWRSSSRADWPDHRQCSQWSSNA